MKLTFDRESHTYTLDGVRVPSVTQILRDSGATDTQWFDSYYASRGNAVHSAITYWLERDLDESTVAPEIRGYLEAFCKFRADTKWRTYRTEYQVVSRRFRFAGTIDAYGLLNGRRAIIDFKSGALGQVGMQLAAYMLAARESRLRPQARFSLRLLPNGDYRLREHSGRDDGWRFLKCLEKVRAA